MGVLGEPNGILRDADTPSEGSHDVEREDSTIESGATFVPPGRLAESAAAHDQTSQDVKLWLSSFGELEAGTSVSRRFLLSKSNYPTGEPFTMLPMLAEWMHIWFKRAIDVPQDRTNLSWLLQYTADYIVLGHHHLDEEEIYELCLTLLFICKNARQHSHIEGCLSVFLSIVQVRQFPRACLEDVLRTLSSAIVILDRPLSRIGECVKLLATGDLCRETITALYAQLLLLSNKELQQDGDSSKYLTPARGALRHLGDLLETRSADEKLVVNVHELLGVLTEIADSKILRLATDLLRLLTKILLSSRVSEVAASDELVISLLNVASICERSSVIPDATDYSLAKTKSPKEDQQNRERRYKRDHEVATRSFRDALASALHLMESEDAAKTWNTIKGGLDSLKAESRVCAVEYIQKNQICMPGSGPHWKEELMLLLEKVVIGQWNLTDAQLEKELRDDDALSNAFLQLQVNERVKQRISILQLCARAICANAEQDQTIIDDLMAVKSAANFGQQALQRFLSIFRTERNSEVIRAFLDELLAFASTEVEDGGQPCALPILQYLQDNILRHAPSDNTADGTYFAGTETIRAIFLQTLNSQTDTASQAYMTLLKIANSKECKSRRCRLAAMSLLFRIRCDTSGQIYIDTGDDSIYIATAVCKTDESLSAMFAETDTSVGEASNKLRSIFRRQLWMYPREQAALEAWFIPRASNVHVKDPNDGSNSRDLDISEWLWVIFTNLQEDKDWETYSYVIVHLGSQLVNTKMFEHSLEILAGLRGFLCGRVRETSKMFEPPAELGLAKVDVALCFYHILMRMIPYYKMQPPNPNMPESGRKGIDLVRAFRSGIDQLYEGTARSCIHALSICCYETPEAIGSEYPAIIDVMARNVTRSHILVHILEFLALVARLPQLHRYFMESEVEKIFIICTTALSSLRPSQELKSSTPIETKRPSSHPSAHTRRTAGLQTPYRAAMLKEKGLTQYSCALAYHTMIFWFLSIPIGQRHRYVQPIIRRLVWEDKPGHETIDQQTIVLLDLMQRTAFSDLPETKRDESFGGDDYETTTYVDGHSVITIETHRSNGRSQITKRQASGTTHAVYDPKIQTLPAHHDRAFYEELDRRGFPDRVMPSHTLLNMIGSAVPFSLPEQPLKLNSNEEYAARTIRLIDGLPTVDSHKIAITLLKDRQSEETEYLANVDGTRSYDEFLDRIGTRMPLKPPCAFVPHGLREDSDGPETIAWRDRINEIMYAVSTLMPNVAEDTYQARKKAHLGNCAVLIVFNQSNKPWSLPQFSTQVTLIHIVITPANRVSASESSNDFEHEYFQVEVATQEEYQNISAAAETKFVSKSSLAPFIRMLALNANIFAGCALQDLRGDNEFPSSWRERLREITQLRARTQERTHDVEDSLAKRYDFSRWT